MATGADSWHSPGPPPSALPSRKPHWVLLPACPPILALPKVRGDGPVLAHRPWSAL